MPVRSSIALSNSRPRYLQQHTYLCYPSPMVGFTLILALLALASMPVARGMLKILPLLLIVGTVALL